MKGETDSNYRDIHVTYQCLDVNTDAVLSEWKKTEPNPQPGLPLTFEKTAIVLPNN